MNYKIVRTRVVTDTFIVTTPGLEMTKADPQLKVAIKFIKDRSFHGCASVDVTVHNQKSEEDVTVKVTHVTPEMHPTKKDWLAYQG